MILSDCRKKLNSDYLRDNQKCSRHKTDSETGGKVTYAGVQSNQAKRLVIRKDRCLNTHKWHRCNTLQQS